MSSAGEGQGTPAFPFRQALARFTGLPAFPLFRFPINYPKYPANTAKHPQPLLPASPPPHQAPGAAIDDADRDTIVEMRNVTAPGALALTAEGLRELVPVIRPSTPSDVRRHVAMDHTLSMRLIELNDVLLRAIGETSVSFLAASLWTMAC